MEIEANKVGDVKLRTFDAGYMTIQIGANESQILNMNFPEVSCLNLGLRTSDGTDTISVATQDGSLLTMDAAWIERSKKYPMRVQLLVLIRIVWRQPIPVLI